MLAGSDAVGDTVDEEGVPKDDTRTVNLYHIAGNLHADTLLMAYLPKERLLVKGDVFSPGAAVQPCVAVLTSAGFRWRLQSEAEDDRAKRRGDPE